MILQRELRLLITGGALQTDKTKRAYQMMDGERMINSSERVKRKRKGMREEVERSTLMGGCRRLYIFGGGWEGTAESEFYSVKAGLMNQTSVWQLKARFIT